MIRILLTTFLSFALAGQAQALSCMAPSFASSFKTANEADASYVLVLGQLEPLPGETIPEDQGVGPNDREGYSVQVRFEGKMATPTGFDHDVSFPLTVEVTCAGPWCGGVPRDRIIAFVERRGEENILVEGPCPRFALSANPERVAAAESCVTDGICDAPQ